MTDPQREHLHDTIARLERSRGRWRLATLILAAVLVMPVVLGGLLGVVWLPHRAELERARAAEAEKRAVLERRKALAAMEQWMEAFEREQARRSQEWAARMEQASLAARLQEELDAPEHPVRGLEETRRRTEARQQQINRALEQRDRGGGSDR
jgi:hypothetical protein